MDKKYSSKAPKNWFTPTELSSIWSRCKLQFQIDGSQDACEIKPGLDHYVLRQILHHAEQVRNETDRV